MAFNTNSDGYAKYLEIATALVNAYTTIRNGIESNNDGVTIGTTRSYLDSAMQAVIDMQSPYSGGGGESAESVDGGEAYGQTLETYTESNALGLATVAMATAINTSRKKVSYNEAKKVARGYVSAAVTALQTYITNSATNGGLADSDGFTNVSSGNFYYDMINGQPYLPMTAGGRYMSEDWAELNTDLNITIADNFVYHN